MGYTMEVTGRPVWPQLHEYEFASKVLGLMAYATIHGNIHFLKK